MKMRNWYGFGFRWTGSTCFIGKLDYWELW